MGLSYGQAFESPETCFRSGLLTLPDAETAVRANWALRGVPDAELVWRVEAVRYSACSLDVNGCENYYTTAPRLELFGFRVLRWTQHGATLDRTVSQSGIGRNKWVDLRPGAKQWASRTPSDALSQFANRRRRQLYILERQMRRARDELNLAVCEPPHA